MVYNLIWIHVYNNLYAYLAAVIIDYSAKIDKGPATKFGLIVSVTRCRTQNGDADKLSKWATLFLSWDSTQNYIQTWD